MRRQIWRGGRFAVPNVNGSTHMVHIPTSGMSDIETIWLRGLLANPAVVDKEGSLAALNIARCSDSDTQRR